MELGRQNEERRIRREMTVKVTENCGPGIWLCDVAPF